MDMEGALELGKPISEFKIIVDTNQLEFNVSIYIKMERIGIDN